MNEAHFRKPQMHTNKHGRDKEVQKKICVHPCPFASFPCGNQFGYLCFASIVVQMKKGVHP